jgi:hypothetical protein
VKRSEINRDTPGARAWLAKPRPRIRQRSAKKAQKDREFAKTRVDALERDDWTCRLADIMEGHHCTRWLPPQVHHMLPRGRGGAHDPGGLVTVCAGAHAWIDEHPREAELFGFLVSDKWRAIRECEDEAS